MSRSNEIQPIERPTPLAIARALLDEGAACDGFSTLNYERCSCDEAAGYLSSDPPRVGDALEVVRMGLGHALREDGLTTDRPEVTMLLAAEMILRGEVVR